MLKYVYGRVLIARDSISLKCFVILFFEQIPLESAEAQLHRERCADTVLRVAFCVLCEILSLYHSEEFVFLHFPSFDLQYNTSSSVHEKPYHGMCVDSFVFGSLISNCLLWTKKKKYIFSEWIIINLSKYL